MDDRDEAGAQEAAGAAASETPPPFMHAIVHSITLTEPCTHCSWQAYASVRRAVRHADVPVPAVFPCLSRGGH